MNSQSEDETNITNTLTAATSVQDASNQTESPPVSDDEEQLSASALVVTPHTQPILPLHQQQVVEKEESVDISGLQLLSNSIEQFESVRIQQTEPQQQAQLETKIKMEVDDNKLQNFNDDDESILNETSSAVDSDLINVVVKQEKECADDEMPMDVTRGETEQDNDKTELKLETNTSSSSGSSMLGGLGLLCELAHQRFIEEEAAAENHVRQRTPSPYDQTSCKYAYFEF